MVFLFLVLQQLWGGQILSCFQPFTKSTGQWFLLPYFVLMLMSPLLNKAIEVLSKKEFIKIILVFSFIVFYFGLLCQNPIIDKGHSIIYFIYMYLIGRFVRIYQVGDTWKKKKIALVLLSYFFITLWINYILPHGILRAYRGLIFSYIAPGQIMSSVGILIFFSKIKMKSKFVNWIAASALSVYLFHENMFIPLKGFFATYAFQYQWFEALFLILVSSCLIMLLALLGDLFIVRPILAILEPLVVNILCIIKTKLLVNNQFCKR